MNFEGEFLDSLLGRNVPSGNEGSHYVAYPIPLVMQVSRPFTVWQSDK